MKFGVWGRVAPPSLRIQTLAGDDMVFVASVVFALIQLVVDLGPDG